MVKFIKRIFHKVFAVFILVVVVLLLAMLIIGAGVVGIIASSEEEGLDIDTSLSWGESFLSSIEGWLEDWIFTIIFRIPPMETGLEDYHAK